jgi:hypothetical protein
MFSFSRLHVFHTSYKNPDSQASFGKINQTSPFSPSALAPNRVIVVGNAVFFIKTTKINLCFLFTYQEKTNFTERNLLLKCENIIIV